MSIRVVRAGGDSITLERICPLCGTIHRININMSIKTFTSKFNEYNNPETRPLIQNVFPELSIDQREFIMTGICNDCFDKMG